MTFYESVLIIRQDVSSSDVDKIIDDFKKIIADYAGEVLKTEYWGLRTLDYEIENNKKGHYYFLGIKADRTLLAEIKRKIHLSESIIRSSIIRVNKISQEPSAILRVKDTANEDEIIDVTSNKKK